MKLYETTLIEWNEKPAAIRLKCVLSTDLELIEVLDSDEPPPGKVWLHLNGGFYKKGAIFRIVEGPHGGIQKSEV